MTRPEVIGLFPIPFVRVPKALPGTLVERLKQSGASGAEETNVKSSRLHHSTIADPENDPVYADAVTHLGPHLRSFGKLLFGQQLTWIVKEIWVNVMQTGGSQAIHSHSNSFASGIVFLTETDTSARTVFHRDMGVREFVFANAGQDVEMGPFNSTKWVAPPCGPGDLLLWPSYLLHEVPPNEGDVRMTMAFNAIPDRLDSWGYGIHLKPSTPR